MNGDAIDWTTPRVSPVRLDDRESFRERAVVPMTTGIA